MFPTISTHSQLLSSVQKLKGDNNLNSIYLLRDVLNYNFWAETVLVPN